MERNANYALVGLISTILMIALIVFIFWLTNFALSAHYDTYDIVFHGPISGLSRGGDVQFNGIKVGEVSDIKLDPNRPDIVHAYARVRSDTPVRQDSAASLEPLGITGVNFIQLTAGTIDKKLLKDVTPAGEMPQIQAGPGALSSLLAGGGSVMQQASTTLAQIDKVLTDQNIKKVSNTLTNVEDVTAELKARKAIIAHADQALQDADQTMVQIRDLSKSAQGLVDNDGRKTLGKISDAAGEIQGAAADVRKLIGKVQGPTSDFAKSGLPQLTAAIASLEKTTRDLDRLLEEVERDPRAFVGKPPAKQVEVKP
jgi:phospholipid/cholesterol/gamma-HCH transport system substrate-binding protein